MSRVIQVLVAMLLLATFVAACGDDEEETVAPTTDSATPVTSAGTPPTSTAGSDASATVPADTETAVEESADGVLVALGDHDRDRIRDFASDRLLERHKEQDFERLHDCIPEGASIEMLSRTVEVNGDRATVTQQLKLTMSDGTTREVERAWMFELSDDGTWVLSEMPDCPFN